MNTKLIQAHLFLTGKVQGVGMRFYLQALAARYSLAGFVRNLSDGRVEAVLEGPKNQIEHVLHQIKQGEYAEYVKSVACTWETAAKPFEHFKIVP